MPIFQYRALSQVGEVVTGDLEAPSLGEVNRRIEYLGLIPIEASPAAGARPFAGDPSTSSHRCRGRAPRM